MNSKTQKVTVIIVFVLVLLFGVGQFFARAPLPSANQQADNAPTQVVRYAPPEPASSTSVVPGSCWTNSIAAPYRADAWRCAVGNGIQDPCFEIGGSTSTLLCGINPENPASSSTFVLSLTKPLPPPEVILPSVPSSMVWLIKLQNGTLCTPFTGTLPPVMEGENTANYDCAPGPLGKETVIFGSLNSSTSVWTANVGTLSASTSTFPPLIVTSSVVPVAEVWQ
jgi:hypothetical protein